jgi:hypothetical protein
LIERGIRPEVLVEAVGEPFGAPLAVIATGSLFAGFGNASSDVDVIGVADDDRITNFPIVEHVGGTRIDIAYLAAERLAGLEKRLVDARFPRAEATRRGWTTDRRDFDLATRLAVGQIVRAVPPWGERVASFSRGWLASRVADWWSVESTRRWIAAEWLVEQKPLLAAMRYFEAAVAACQAGVSRAGDVYFAEKWLFEKLARAERTSELDAIRGVLALPSDPGELRSHRARCRAIVESEAIEVRPDVTTIQVFLAPGVTVHDLADRRIAQRWGLRYVDVDETLADADDHSAPLWRGPAADAPPAIVELFVHDMVWLGVCGGDAHA